MRRGFRTMATGYLPGHAFWMHSFHHMLKYRGLARLFDPLDSLVLLAGFPGFDTIRATIPTPALGANTP